MKTTAEEKLLRALEEVVEDGAKGVTRAEFIQNQKEAQKTIAGVIASHRRMIGLWSAMGSRTRKRARLILAKSKKPSGGG